MPTSNWSLAAKTTPEATPVSTAALVVDTNKLPDESITNLFCVSTFVVPITKLSVAASCPIEYLTTPASANFNSASKFVWPSSSILASPESSFMCKWSKGLSVPIPTLPDELI